MKSAVIYYSYSGNTHRVAQLIIDLLKNKGEEAIPIRIRPLKEEASFIVQCIEAFLGKKPKLYRTLLDLKDFDRVIMGSPAWAFKPAPAINSYLNECSSLDGKTAILCYFESQAHSMETHQLLIQTTTAFWPLADIFLK